MSGPRFRILGFKSSEITVSTHPRCDFNVTQVEHTEKDRQSERERERHRCQEKQKQKREREMKVWSNATDLANVQIQTIDQKKARVIG